MGLYGVFIGVVLENVSLVSSFEVVVLVICVVIVFVFCSLIVDCF